VVELPAVALEFGARIEDLAEDVLDDTDVLANAERTATPVFNVGRSHSTSSPRSRLKVMSSSADSVAVRPEAAS
jgi:hypothetical protein